MLCTQIQDERDTPITLLCAVSVGYVSDYNFAVFEIRHNRSTGYYCLWHQAGAEWQVWSVLDKVVHDRSPITARSVFHGSASIGTLRISSRYEVVVY